jgi:phthalate 4,5-dioxygenase oxygenase subunit
MLSVEDNMLLCRVESDAPMGSMMRRYWIPALPIEQIQEPDSDPVRLRLLGEKLVAFRDTSGRVGVLGEFCAHRKASLVFGRNEECGLRCLYHGWKFDVDGNVLEMPSEPTESALADRARQKAYPVREAGGFVWVYMGPADTMPEFEPPAWCPTGKERVAITRIEVACNWAQIMEGNIDSAHSSSLHSSEIKPSPKTSAWTRPSTDKNPRIQVERTNYGMRYAAIRRPIVNSAESDYVRVTTFIAPYTTLIPPNIEHNLCAVVVPCDDVSSYFHLIAWGDGPDAPDTDAWRAFCFARVGVDVDKDFRPILRTAANNYAQDRDAMRAGHFVGIPGIPNQDIPMWESMGPIADRTSERLGASDIAVVEFRRLMVDAVKQFIAGATPIGLSEPRAPHATLKSYQAVLSKAENWREFHKDLSHAGMAPSG